MSSSSLRRGFAGKQGRWLSSWSRRCSLAALTIATTLMGSTEAEAFSYVVRPGDTLAGIAERFYGRIQHERLLVAANGLDLEGGSPIVAGMRLEVPAVTHHRIEPGDTWKQLAADMLGSPERADFLSIANDSTPWQSPAEGAEVLIPYNLHIIARRGDSITTLAYRYLGNMAKAWIIDRYNGLRGSALQPGDAVLIPLVDLKLTEEGRRAAEAAQQAACGEAGGSMRSEQSRVQAELPTLIADVKAGRYVEAVARGSRFLATTQLSRPARATIHRQLLEAYTALGAAGLATASCDQWLKLEPSPNLDPVLLSPKILASCERALASRGDAASPATSSSAAPQGSGRSSR